MEVVGGVLGSPGRVLLASRPSLDDDASGFEGRRGHAPLDALDDRDVLDLQDIVDVADRLDLGWGRFGLLEVEVDGLEGPSGSVRVRRGGSAGP